MNIKQLKEYINDLPDDMELININGDEFSKNDIKFN